MNQTNSNSARKIGIIVAMQNDFDGKLALG